MLLPVPGQIVVLSTRPRSLLGGRGWACLCWHVARKAITSRKSARGIPELGSSPIADEVGHPELATCSSPHTNDTKKYTFNCWRKGLRECMWKFELYHRDHIGKHGEKVIHGLSNTWCSYCTNCFKEMVCNSTTNPYCQYASLQALA